MEAPDHRRFAMSEHVIARRATFPPQYGERGGEGDEPLEWAMIEEKIRAASNYWLATVTPDGRPYARPVDGVWVDGALCFGGSPDTRWVRNLSENPALSVHLPSGDDVVVLDGTAELITDPDHPLAAASKVANRAKYPQYFSDDADPTPRPFWCFRPKRAFAWTLDGFPNRATRWDLGSKPE